MGDNTGHTGRYVLLFAAGTALGSALAFGAAYAVAKRYAATAPPRHTANSSPAAVSGHRAKSRLNDSGGDTSPRARPHELGSSPVSYVAHPTNYPSVRIHKHDRQASRPASDRNQPGVRSPRHHDGPARHKGDGIMHQGSNISAMAASPRVSAFAAMDTAESTASEMQEDPGNISLRSMIYNRESAATGAGHAPQGGLNSGGQDTEAAQRSHMMSASAVAGVLARQPAQGYAPTHQPLSDSMAPQGSHNARSSAPVSTAPVKAAQQARASHMSVAPLTTSACSRSQAVSSPHPSTLGPLNVLSAVSNLPAQAILSGDPSNLDVSMDTCDYMRVVTPEIPMNEEVEGVCTMMLEMLGMRCKWLFKPAVTPEQRRHEPEAAAPSELEKNPLVYRPLAASAHTYRMVDGVMEVHLEEGNVHEVIKAPGPVTEFFTDMHRILRYGALGPVKSFSHHRLMLLEQKFNLHVMLNADKEFLAQKLAPHRDFYNVRKVDTHIHHSACMHQKHLLRFIKSKLRKEPDEVVIFRDGKYLTLREVFESLNLSGHDLNVDTLDMHADKSLFHRFDKFNLKYNPCGQSRLREIFIKQDNIIHGRFLAELTKEVFDDLEASKYQHAEMRVSIYGRKAMEWDILASWVVANKLYSDNNVWLIQIPRLYNIYKETGVIDNFQEMLDNIFQPLFEVTKDPSSHPQLHVLLSQVVGFDSVDDESKPERRPTKHSPPPAEWNSKHNCAYSYYAYFIYANLYVLNKFREARGLNTFTFRPHAGEAGDIDHLATAFMLCENIAHGINLRKSPCLQYLFYLAQVGLCMSPLSNNSLFLDYHRNPMPTFFARGLSVSLSTDDPLQIHLTKEPLVEEYSVAAQVWKLSSTDLCEIARNGVLHSGFPHACKKHWVAEEYWRHGPLGNDIQKTNVPDARLRFRYESHMSELHLLMSGVTSHLARKAAATLRDA